MEATANDWKILDRDRGVLTRTYRFSGGMANCYVCKTPEGLLVVSPALGMTDDGFADLDDFGKVAAVVAPNGFHHLGLAEWRERFPEARFFASEKAAARIHKKNDKAPDLEPIAGVQELLGDDVGLRDAPSTKCGETWAWARAGDGWAWFGSDILNNMPSLPKNPVVRAAFRFSGSAPGYKLFNLAMLVTMKKKKENLAAMLEDLRRTPPTIVVPGHGGVLTQEGLAAETEALVRSAL